MIFFIQKFSFLFHNESDHISFQIRPKNLYSSWRALRRGDRLIGSRSATRRREVEMRGVCVSARCSRPATVEDSRFHPTCFARQAKAYSRISIPALCGACSRRRFPANWIVLGSTLWSVNGRAIRVSVASPTNGSQPRASTLHGPSTYYAYTYISTYTYYI